MKHNQLNIICLVLFIIFIIYIFIQNANVCSVFNRNEREEFNVGSGRILNSIGRVGRWSLANPIPAGAIASTTLFAGKVIGDGINDKLEEWKVKKYKADSDFVLNLGEDEQEAKKKRIEKGKEEITKEFKQIIKDRETELWDFNDGTAGAQISIWYELNTENEDGINILSEEVMSIFNNKKKEEDKAIKNLRDNFSDIQIMNGYKQRSQSWKDYEILNKVWEDMRYGRHVWIDDTLRQARI